MNHSFILSGISLAFYSALYLAFCLAGSMTF